MASPRPIRLALAAASTLAALLAAEWVARELGALPWRASSAREGEPVIHEFDAELGWRNRECRERIASYAPRRDPPTCFTGWPGGRRATSGAITPRPRRVVVLGCSYTQGWAISDEETYAWRLQERFPEVELFNYGTAGYGTYQSLLALERHYRDVGEAEVVLFGLASVHEERNLAEAAWLRTLSIGAVRAHVWMPHIALDEHGALRRAGLVRYPSFPWHEQSALIALAETAWARAVHPPREPQRHDAAWRILLEMRARAHEHGSTFLVAALGWSPGIRRYGPRLDAAGIPWVDCEPPYDRRLFVRNEGHPGGAMNLMWAEWIAPLLRDALARP